MPSKTRTTRAVAAVPDRDKPAKAHMNLDTLEREGGSIESFGFFTHGRHFEMVDAFEIDWQDLMAAQQDPIRFFGKAMTTKDAAAFLALKIPTWKLNALIAGYLAHFGIGATGEASASPVS